MTAPYRQSELPEQGKNPEMEIPKSTFLYPNDSVCGVLGFSPIHLCFKPATYPNIYRSFWKTIFRAVALAMSFWVCQGHIALITMIQSSSSSFPGVSKPACVCLWTCVCMCGSSLNETAQKVSFYSDYWMKRWTSWQPYRLYSYWTKWPKYWAFLDLSGMISVASPHCSSLGTFGLWNSLLDLKKSVFGYICYSDKLERSCSTCYINLDVDTNCTVWSFSLSECTLKHENATGTLQSCFFSFFFITNKARHLGFPLNKFRTCEALHILL